MLAFEDALSWAGHWPVLGLLTGFVCLILGADLLVRGAVWVALTLGMSRLTVGLTLVAFGTSAPELLVSLTSATRGECEMAMSNVLGSNNMNVLLIVGTTAAIRAILVKTRWFELGYMLFFSALLRALRIPSLSCDSSCMNAPARRLPVSWRTAHRL